MLTVMSEICRKLCCTNKVREEERDTNKGLDPPVSTFLDIMQVIEKHTDIFVAVIAEV